MKKKQTIYLSLEVSQQIRLLAATSDKSQSELLEEGAKWVIANPPGKKPKETI